MSQVTFDVFRGAKDSSLVRQTVTKQLRPNDVHIEITHSGVCATDINYRQSNIALGHEGVGVVRTVGDAVRDFKVGDIVGFGYVHQVCGVCNNCLTGWDQYCPHRVMYGLADFNTGSFSQGAVVDARCVFHIPKELEPASAAPLMCGGATVWTVLSQYGVKATDRVGVMGVGGLGHIAIKIAAAMGCYVVVFSSREKKREEALTFGAKEFHILRKGERVEGNVEPINHLLLCGSVKVDYSSLIHLMATNGTMYPLTVDFDPSEIVIFQLTLNAVGIQGSVVISTVEMRKMLQFCAEHSITPQIQEFPLSPEGMVDAMTALNKGEVRDRAVLVAHPQK